MVPGRFGAAQPPGATRLLDPFESLACRGEAFQGYGHNAHPVRDEGVACDACNGAIVLPQRFRKWAP